MDGGNEIWLSLFASTVNKGNARVSFEQTKSNLACDPRLGIFLSQNINYFGQEANILGEATLRSSNPQVWYLCPCSFQLVMDRWIWEISHRSNVAIYPACLPAYPLCHLYYRSLFQLLFILHIKDFVWKWKFLFNVEGMKWLRVLLNEHVS